MTDGDKKKILDLCNKPARLGGWLGLPYEQDGCLKFAVRFYQALGIETSGEVMRDAREFAAVDRPRFGDIAVFQNLPFDKFHVAVMLDYRRAIQCADHELTNGVGKIDISRFPWADSLRGFYRHRSLLD